MKKATRTIAAAALLLAVALPAGAASHTVKAVGGSQQALATAAHFDAAPWCIDECPPPAEVLAGSGTFVAR